MKVFLRPYRGERLERDFMLKIPAGLPKGEHRILLSDADTLNRMQSVASASDRFMDIPQTVSLINQERTNNKLYISLIEPRPTVFYEDKTLPSSSGLCHERDADRPHRQPSFGQFRGKRRRARQHSVRPDDRRQLFAKSHR